MPEVHFPLKPWVFHYRKVRGGGEDIARNSKNCRNNQRVSFVILFRLLKSKSSEFPKNDYLISLRKEKGGSRV